MKAFENTLITKEEILKELKWHQEQDAFTKGFYFKEDEVKGCAVGCSINSISRIKGVLFQNDNHALYENYLGIPEWLARVEDTIFEGVSIERSKIWPIEFMEAIKPGSNLEKIKWPFIKIILERNLKSLDDCQYSKSEWPEIESAITGSKNAVQAIIDLIDSGETNAESTARSTAESATRSAVRSAESARSAAWSAAWSADSAAWSVAKSAAWSAKSAAWSAESARSAAWSAAFEYFADELIKLIKECE